MTSHGNTAKLIFTALWLSVGVCVMAGAEEAETRVFRWRHSLLQGMEYHSAGTLPLLGSPRYCAGTGSSSGYLCQNGHCCGQTGCCTYYYELWWFWLLWSLLIVFSCCCAYRHRQAKQRQRLQQQTDVGLMAQRACNYGNSMLDLNFLASLKLPSYEEVAAQPRTPPPPYSCIGYPRGLPRPGPSLMMSSQSSDNYTSCSCDSCCQSSPCSSSPSTADQTDTSHASSPANSDSGHTLRRGSPAAPPATQALPFGSSYKHSSDDPLGTSSLSSPVSDHGNSSITSQTAAVVKTTVSQPGSAPLSLPLSTPLPLMSPVPLSCPPSLALPGLPQDSAKEACSPAEDPAPFSPPRQTLLGPGRRDSGTSDPDVDQCHFQQRRLTGDSGIEVCRCRVEEDEREEEGRSQNTVLRVSSVHDDDACSALAQEVHGEKPKEEGSSFCGHTPTAEMVVIAMETCDGGF
ncbi:WW domain binding protein 1-like [Denticeps clupeoides]|uniref:Uncharacterized protein n=1 Tax=Denticeps clupeoides TaxID=299321 RepID=A0AAY4C566_9TELE|nr:WW domain binding protein 1-like [Denticeps clupeoides]